MGIKDDSVESLGFAFEIGCMVLKMLQGEGLSLDCALYTFVDVFLLFSFYSSLIEGIRGIDCVMFYIPPLVGGNYKYSL